MVRFFLLQFFCILYLCACAAYEAPRPRPVPSVKVELQGFSKWQRVCRAEESRPTFRGDTADVADPHLAEQWKHLYQSVSTKPELDKIRAVNEFFNRFPYKEDRDLWGMEDHWATPRQFMDHSGDCEDFAIAKYYALRELGISVDAMRIAGVWNKRQGKGHAVLIVRSGGEDWVLDNLNSSLVVQGDVTHYVAQYYVNERNIWRKPATGSHAM